VREAEQSPFSAAVAREGLVKTQQTGKGKGLLTLTVEFSRMYYTR
jgi:hypothetical protein